MSPRALRSMWIVAWIAGVACADRGQGRNAAADSLLAPGESLYARGQHDSAATIWTAALGRPGVAGTLAEATLLHWLGLAAYRGGRLEDARRLGERALDRKRALGAGGAQVAESQNALGLLAWSEGRLGDAAALLGEARRGFEGEGDRAGVAKAANNLALVALELGRFAEAREGFEAARAAARATGNARTEGRATTNLAMIEIWSGDPGRAPALLQAARRLADSVGDPVGMENAIGQLAVAWSALGDPGRALATLDSAIATARAHGLREEEANDLLVAASMYRDAGDADRAIELYAQARAIHDALGLDAEAGMVLRHEAVLRAARGAYERARTDATRALALHRQDGARLEEFHDLVALGDIETGAGDHPRATGHLAAARRLVADLDAPQTRMALALAEARLHDGRGAADAVLEALDRARADLPVSGFDVSVQAEWLRTRAHAALGRLDSAVAAGRRAVAMVERARNTHASPVLRTSYTVERSRVFADLVLALLRVGEPDEAFAVADAARGRVLIDHLSIARADAERSPMLRDLAERERLLRRIDALVSRLEAVQSRPRRERGVDDEATGIELAERLARARAEFEAVMVRVTTHEPSRATLLGTRQVSPTAIREALERDEVLLEYLVTADRLIIFAVRRDGLTPVEVMVPMAELENRVRLARGLIASRPPADSGAAVLEELHRLLIYPVERADVLRGARRLVIVPHGALSYLPFAALRHPASRRRLIEDYSVQYLTTSAGLAALRAHPVQQGGPARTTVLAPFPERLPATSREAAAVERRGRASRRLVGVPATERALRRALAEGDVVHVATHGLMNPVNPMFSNLELWRGTGAPDDDGRLEVHELLGMTARSPLVFLSGCETGLGAARATAFERHEDYATLAQAFLFAGARAVVATLWRIDDEGAARFAARFYEHLTRLPAVDALAAAQRELMHDAAWGHPFYWAGYTIAGDVADGPSANRASPSVSH